MENSILVKKVSLKKHIKKLNKNLSKIKTMEQLEQNTSEENIISFLAYFNEIDKHFDKVL
jgi:hypothetical protein